ncbi:hypothetical protein Geu3261_0017_014 [Komagataeibacter europaeus NBRC 3261]|uniref:Uncharacterized protein n=1 Tax=Komagataeibacter europaeus NBRC 3261 TaxID=1234669 RepID=A0A0D6PW57_KOMEU|nr:hypothetical protein Geu3261_0017_014 [Komagataeibacter europaeus NBRC 3261]
MGASQKPAQPGQPMPSDRTQPTATPDTPGHFPRNGPPHATAPPRGAAPSARRGARNHIARAHAPCATAKEKPFPKMNASTGGRLPAGADVHETGAEYGRDHHLPTARPCILA